MNWQRFWNRISGGPARRETDLDEEMSFHVQMKTRELIEAGVSPEAARAEAQRSFGNVTLVREQAREAWSFAWLTDALQDVKYGARSLAAQPSFAAAAIVALVLGIGVNAILFNVYNALALTPYAMRDGAQTVQIWADRGRSWNGFSWPEYRYLREHTATLSGMVATTNGGIRVGQRSGETGWTGEAVMASENFFDVVGTGFTYGRGFSPEAGAAINPAPEIVLHHNTWVARFGADPGAVGRWIDVNGHQFRIVGVTVPGFSGPAAVHPTAWIPGAWRDIFDPDMKTYNSADHCCIQVIGRLRDGASRPQVQAELGALRAQFQSQLGREPRGVRVTTPAILASPKAQSQALPVFLALAVTAGLILALACANVANLQIARAIARRREMSVRIALGAGRGRLLRQMLAESLLLAAIAAGISIALSAWAPDKIVSFIANEERGLTFRFENDLRVIAFIAAVTVLAAVMSGLGPAWTAVREAVVHGLKEGAGGRGSSSGAGMRRFLLGCQVMLSAILVSGAALMVRVADHTRHADPGFSHSNVILASLGLNSSGVTDEQARALIADLKGRVAALPGVERVAHSIAVPMGNTNMSWGIRDARGGQRSVGVDRVSANFLDTLRIPMLAGTPFQAADEPRAEAAIVNKAAAELLWPGESPIGKPVEPGSNVVVSGVAPNITTRHFGSEGNPHVWIAAAPVRDSRLLIRHAPGAAEAIVAALPEIARQQDRRFLVTAEPYTETFTRAQRGANIAAAVAAVLGGLALLLACVGVYGVAAYSVSQRTREIGVRMALGARPSNILGMILRQNLRTVAIGAAVGLAGALGFANLLKSILYGLAPTDPVALATTVLILGGTAVVATWAPAHRASAIDPSITLRQD